MWVNQKTNAHKVYEQNPSVTNSLADNAVNTVMVDGNDQVWIGTHTRFHHLDPKTGKIEQFKFLPNESMPSPPPQIPRTDFVAGKNVYDIYSTGDGRLF